MSQMNLTSTRVGVDPILTAVAQGFQNNELIGSELFPVVSVPQRSGTVISFGKEDFMLYNTGRAPGSDTKQVQFGYSGGKYALESHSLEGLLPIELMQEADAVPGIDMSALTVSKTQAIIALRLEKAQADLARDASKYPAGNKTALSGTSQWSDFSGVSDPVKDIEVGKEAVRKSTGKRPNLIEIPAAVFAVLKQHPKIVDRIKYTGRDIATPELLASLFGVTKVVIGEAVFADDQGNFSDVWGKDVILAYVTPGALKDRGLPTFGYTYQLEGYAQVEEPYFQRGKKSWVYPVTDEVAPQIAGAIAGYLIQNAVA